TEIRVSWQPDPGRERCSASRDNGPGIAPEHIPRRGPKFASAGSRTPAGSAVQRRGITGQALRRSIFP
ncbi:hypothetical protein C0U44_32590, partial [Klebsiella pneumoniae]